MNWWRENWPFAAVGVYAVGMGVFLLWVTIDSEREKRERFVDCVDRGNDAAWCFDREARR